MTPFVIVGAGLHGCALGWELAQRGADVTVIERGVPGAEASTAAAGMLVPTLEACLHGGQGLAFDIGRQSLALYPGWVAAVERASGRRVPLHLDGALLTTGEPHNIDGLGLLRLDADELRALEPSLTVKAAGWWAPDEGWVDPRVLVPAVHIAALAAGVRVRAGEVVALDPAGVTMRAEEGDVTLPGTVVVCAGAWTSRVPGLERLPVRPIRGQVVSLRPHKPAPGRVIFGGGGVYIVPRDDGRVLVGATMEDVGFTRGVTPEGVASLCAAGARVAPGLEHAELLDAWSGFRPSTPDGLPLLGSWGGVWVASGHHRNGILLAPYSARAMTAALLDGAPLPQALSPARFGPDTG